MTDPRASGPTFAAADIGWFDFETRSNTAITAGSYRYACEANAIVLAWAIGDGPVKVFTVPVFDGALRWEDMPDEIRLFHSRVCSGRGVWAAWNAGFDRAIWNYATIGFPEMEPHHVIDVMAQAVASGLPPDLATAARMSGSTVKVEAGKDLIKLFCTAEGLRGVCGTPQSHPHEWATFVHVYATGDVAAMRSVFKGTRQLPRAEWEEYWAMEAINSRGVCIDTKMVANAAALAGTDKQRSKLLLKQLTGAVVETVDQVARITAWLMTRLPPDGQAILTKRVEEVDEETGDVIKPAKLALTRKRIERLIVCVEAAIDHPNIQAEYARELRRVLAVLQIRRYGGSKTPAKFARMIEQQVDGVLYGQYVFNGASQTGRASSKGVQIHNLARDPLPFEPDAIEGILRNIKYDELMLLGDASPVARKLSLLIRPAFIPSGDKVFVWSDWSQIEARVLPWLCDHYEGARERLQIFRDVDADPSLPDLYTRTAAKLSHVAIADVTKAMRQRGKVAELALGFCGGVGALQAMAANYGLYLSDDEAKETVDGWRKANPWAIDFSREIWETMRATMNNPCQPFKVGRIWMRFEPDYLGGSLLCRLPSGRLLTYRELRWEDVNVLDEDDMPTGTKKLELTYARGYGRAKLWPGIFVENFTQATAACVLRGTLVRLEQGGFHIRLHTHDEVLGEVPEAQAEAYAEALRDAMCCGFSWSEGLPLKSEETTAYCYTKHEGSHWS